MSERLRLGDTEPAKGLEGALQRSRHRAAGGYATPVPKPRPAPAELVTEPTGQHAVVVNDRDEVFVRLQHRWYQAGGSTKSPVPWPQIHAVRVVYAGDPR